MDGSSAVIAQGSDGDAPATGQQFAQFAAGCFWGVELAFQRVPGVTKTEAGYSQGTLHNPTYKDVCTGKTGHSEIVRLQYDPDQCCYEDLLDVFWSRHDPTQLNRQSTVKLWEMFMDGASRAHNFGLCVTLKSPPGVVIQQAVKGNDVGTQYRSGIYYYSQEQEKAARETLERQEKNLGKKVVTEILPAKKFYRAEEYHQQYLEKGGRSGSKQSASKCCSDPIRCYG